MLLYACARETIKLYKPFLDELDLTYTLYITMPVLFEHGRMTLKELGSCLYPDSGTLTPMLKKLEEKGLVSRKRSTADERNLIVGITPAGEALKGMALHIPGEMKKCVNLEPEEIRVLYKLLYKLVLYVSPRAKRFRSRAAVRGHFPLFCPVQKKLITF